jgi:hypothetical protein
LFCPQNGRSSGAGFAIAFSIVRVDTAADSFLRGNNSGVRGTSIFVQHIDDPEITAWVPPRLTEPDPVYSPIL